MVNRTLFVAVLLVTPPAAAFGGLESFTRPTLDGGSDRAYFTGSPRFKRYHCGACHVEAPERARAVLSSDPSSLVDWGVYVPGATYKLRIDVEGAPPEPLVEAQNGVLLEMLDDLNQPTGAFSGYELQHTRGPHGPEVDGVVAGRPFQQSWTFEYTAPTEGTGRITLYLSGVVGAAGVVETTDGLTTNSGPYGDDVYVLAHRFCESGRACDVTAPEPTAEAESPAAHGCQASPTPSALPWLGLLLLVFLGSRRRLRWVSMVLALIVHTGCFEPRLPTECEDRVCGEVVESEGGMGMMGGMDMDGMSMSGHAPPRPEGYAPEPCDCSGCWSQAECEAGCPDVPADADRICFFETRDEFGCWFTSYDQCPHQPL